MHRSRSILRSTFLLVAGTAALILFIGFTGDSRRRNNAMTRARQHAAELTRRMGEGGQLPLNLSAPEVTSNVGAIGMEWVSSADAYVLRHANERLLVAWTVPIVCALGADGRAVVFFNDKRFSVAWVSLEEFERLRSLQAATIEKARERESS